jgi:hypothetical protein
MDMEFKIHLYTIIEIVVLLYLHHDMTVAISLRKPKRVKKKGKTGKRKKETGNNHHDRVSSHSGCE